MQEFYYYLSNALYIWQFYTYTEKNNKKYLFEKFLNVY